MTSMVASKSKEEKKKNNSVKASSSSSSSSSGKKISKSNNNNKKKKKNQGRPRQPPLGPDEWSLEERSILDHAVNNELQNIIIDDRNIIEGDVPWQMGYINWPSISNNLPGRTPEKCCRIWSSEMACRMNGREWLETDDYLMILKLMMLDHCCMDDVGWDTMLQWRSGRDCRRRWQQLTRYISGFGRMTFDEEIEKLAERKCKKIMEHTEAFGYSSIKYRKIILVHVLE